MHDVGDVVGHLPERALERHESCRWVIWPLWWRDTAPRRVAPRDAAEQAPRDGDGCASTMGRQERRRGDSAARLVVAHREPAERAALQAERLDHRLRRDVFLHHAQQRGFIELLLRNSPAPPSASGSAARSGVIGNTSSGHRGKLPVQEQHQDDAGDQFQQRQRRALLAKLLIDPSNAERSMEKRDRISPRLVRAKYADGRFWTCSNSRVRTSEISEAASSASPSLVPDRDDRG